MDDGEVELSDPLTGNSSNTFRAPLKLEDPVLNDSLKNRRTCRQTHPDHHDSVEPGRPSGNRVAVKKYREKKKAQNAYLEEEVKKLRVVNRGLIRKLQLQADLELEAVRLRRLLLDLKARIDAEMGGSPFYKQSCNGSSDGCSGGD
ncbi:basic leucine zipper 24-like [Cynara cardunculus var. scolymus]|uniref:Basic-leucine zipper domain-containing protein n=1 Tax=Cynara cardunculus var. scolymus TaxID=59895 RepID=A0A103XUZ3_CYNCS|nr:basic leucine zipper 24-like [Cynara cardunculus var. scolymus]KVH97364.1 Basic-leucine zipper domain-containing protein [Cynara cardunculus var. scolymus]